MRSWEHMASQSAPSAPFRLIRAGDRRATTLLDLELGERDRTKIWAHETSGYLMLLFGLLSERYSSRSPGKISHHADELYDVISSSSRCEVMLKRDSEPYEPCRHRLR